MATPIFILWTTAKLSSEQFRFINQSLKEKLHDYHTLIIEHPTDNKIEIFGSEKIDSIQIEDLKNKINGSHL